MKTIKKKAAFRYPATAEALDISDDIWARLNLLEIAAFHPDVMLHFRGSPSYLWDYAGVLYVGIMQR